MRLLSERGLKVLVISSLLAFASCDEGSGPQGLGLDAGGTGPNGPGTGNMIDPTIYRFLVVTDISENENAAGMPGADICGVRLECAGQQVLGAVAEDADL